MLRRPEASALDVTTKFRDENNALTIPMTVRVKLTCETTGQTILDWTAITAATTVTVSITPTQNRILNRTNAVERKTLSIEADSGLSTAIADAYTYEVARVAGLS